MGLKKRRVQPVNLLMALLVAPVGGALFFYIMIMGQEILLLISSDHEIDFILFMLGLSIMQIAFFAIIMLFIIIVLAMPFYLVLHLFDKASILAVNSIGLVIGTIVGTLMHSGEYREVPYIILICTICGVITSNIFYKITRTSNKSLNQIGAKDAPPG